jgi:hypothetical protein
MDNQKYRIGFWSLVLFVAVQSRCASDREEKAAQRLLQLQEEAAEDKKEMRATSASLQTWASQLADRTALLEEATTDLNSAAHVEYRSIPLNRTGAEICGLYGESCLGVTPSRVGTRTEPSIFTGFITFTCSTRVRESPGCWAGAESRADYSFGPGQFRHHPDSRVPFSPDREMGVCTHTPYHRSAVCLKIPMDLRE